MPQATEGVHHDLTMANEDYLESIYRITLETEDPAGIRSVDVADQLQVSKASVNKAISTLKDGCYVEQNRYGRVMLTPAGREYAAHVWRCHRMLRTFLNRDLGVDYDTADAEACLMEHALSYDTQRRWLTYLEGQGITIDD